MEQNVTGLQWLTKLTTDPTIQKPSYRPYMTGHLGLAVHGGDIPGLRDFLRKMHPDNDPDYNYIVSL